MIDSAICPFVEPSQQRLQRHRAIHTALPQHHTGIDAQKCPEMEVRQVQPKRIRPFQAYSFWTEEKGIGLTSEPLPALEYLARRREHNVRRARREVRLEV